MRWIAFLCVLLAIGCTDGTSPTAVDPCTIWVTWDGTNQPVTDSLTNCPEWVRGPRP